MTITIELTAEQEAALIAATDKYNKTILVPQLKLTPEQFFRTFVGNWVDSHVREVQRVRDDMGRELYRRANEADRRAIDNILRKYQ